MYKPQFSVEFWPKDFGKQITLNFPVHLHKVTKALPKGFANPFTCTEYMFLQNVISLS